MTLIGQRPPNLGHLASKIRGNNANEILKNRFEQTRRPAITPSLTKNLKHNQMVLDRIFFKQTLRN